jgi:hypothetical protein
MIMTKDRTVPDDDEGFDVFEALKDEYETPRACVCGVFLEKSLADTAISVRGSIMQEDWEGVVDELVGDTNSDGNIVLSFQ